jgi:ABC-type transport system substrate-binding protein
MLGGLSLAGLSACGQRRAAPEGDLLRVAIGGMPDSLDPAIGQFATAALVYKQIHGPLTDYGPEGGVVPGLARDWSANENATRWTFRLYDGLQWSDGTPLNAEDIVWSARRIVDPASTFAQIGDFYSVLNAPEVLRQEAPPEAMGVRALDPLTVEFEMTAPISFFPLLMREFYPFPRHAIEAHGSDWTRRENFVGCGPFVVSGAGALSLQLRRNPLARNPARIENVHIEAVEDAATRQRLFRAGDYDLADNPMANQIALLSEQIGDRLHGYPAPKFTYLKVNVARVGDPQLRERISLVIDRQFIADNLLPGVAAPTRTVIPASSSGDMGARYPAGFVQSERPLLLRCLSGERERIAVILADDLAREGIEVELLATPATDLYQAVDAGDYDIALAHFDRGLKGEPNFMLEPFAPGQFADNMNWYSSGDPAASEFTALIAQARAAVEDAERDALYRQAERILLGAHVVIPLFHERAFWLISDRVTGLPEAIQPMLWGGAELANA